MEKGHDPLSSSSGQAEEELHKEEYKSLQGDFEKVGNPLLNDEDCRNEESEDECTSSFFVGDFQITAKDIGPCGGGETYFGSNPKEYYKSDL